MLRLLAFATSLRRESWDRKVLGSRWTSRASRAPRWTSRSDKAFGPDGKLIEPKRQARLASMVGGYLALARKLAAG